MPSYPRPCPHCGVMTAEADFGVDRSKACGRRSYCKACDRRRGRAYYDAHKDELYAQRVAAREAARQAELEALEKEHRKRVAAAKRLHAAQVRNQKKLLRELGVPDLSPEEVSGPDAMWFWRAERKWTPIDDDSESLRKGGDGSPAFFTRRTLDTSSTRRDTGPIRVPPRLSWRGEVMRDEDRLRRHI
jgi:hypothetical protein